MFVTRAELVDINGVESHIQLDGIESIDPLIKRLGSELEAVFFEENEGDYMCVVGDGQFFVVAGNITSESFIIASGPISRRKTFSLGGQDQVYANGEVLEFADAIKAAREFVAKGTIHAELKWRSKASGMNGNAG